MKSLDAIWLEYHDRIRHFIGRRVDNLAEVDDLCQEVFLKVYKNLPQLVDSEKLAGWLFRITRNIIHDYYRAKRGQLPLDDSPQLAGENLSVETARRELEGCFLPMIDNLPETYRQAVRLSEIDGLTQAAVAERLHIGLPAAKSRVQRGRRLIRDMMESCCRVEFDHRGHLVDYENRSDGPDFC